MGRGDDVWVVLVSDGATAAGACGAPVTKFTVESGDS